MVRSSGRVRRGLSMMWPAAAALLGIGACGTPEPPPQDPPASPFKSAIDLAPLLPPSAPPVPAADGVALTPAEQPPPSSARARQQPAKRLSLWTPVTARGLRPMACPVSGRRPDGPPRPGKSGCGGMETALGFPYGSETL